ncbi:Disease resistance protein RPH8A [Sesamum alatum]|uniref:Disease resistance protein RPH8A n=1 Tax=Sesamum alatum TaxID=300844 RepID=A0AAE1YE16_9LAMI|nr:Disease resistance protein RPH8A [Sesamum alatum]
MSSNGHLLRVSVKVTNKFDCYTEERVSAFKRLLGCHSLIILCLEGHIRRLPLLHEFSSNLAKIVLVRSELTKDPMPTLEKLPKLRALVLDVDAFIGKKMVCSASGFTELRRLELSNLHYLEKWIVEDKAMLQLSNVVIVNCQKLMMKPEELEFVRHLPQLQQIRVSGMCKEFKDSISMVKDMYKVQHVPSITIEN